MPSLDALYDAKIAATKATASPASSTTVNTTTLAGVNAASTPAPTPVAATGLEAQVGLSSSELTKLPTETNTQFLARVNAAKAAERATSIKANPLLDKSVTPKAQSGYEYKWIGGTNTGQWQLYKLPPSSVSGTSADGTTPKLKFGDPGYILQPGDPGYVAPKNGDGATKLAISTNTITRNGHQVVVTTFDDGTTSEIDYGMSAGDAAKQQNWLNVGKGLLDQYGVGSLWADYQDLIVNKGYDDTSAMLALQSSKAWTDRFWANNKRLAQGLPVLDPATYLATEEKYKDVMISAGIDPSIYKDNMKLGDLMAKDVSPYEVQQRIAAAQFELDNKDPFILKQLQDRFGLTQGDIVLHMLDPNLASSVIAQKVASAKIGAEAARQGKDMGISITEADRLAAAGVTQSQAQTGFSNIGQEQQFAQNLPGDVSGSVTQSQLANAQFGLSAEDTMAVKKVQAARTAEFQTGGAFAASQAGITGLSSNPV